MRKLIIILAGLLALFVFIRDINVAENPEAEKLEHKAGISIELR